jgi:hypothetical protein
MTRRGGSAEAGRLARERDIGMLVQPSEQGKEPFWRYRESADPGGVRWRVSPSCQHSGSRTSSASDGARAMAREPVSFFSKVLDGMEAVF